MRIDRLRTSLILNSTSTAPTREEKASRGPGVGGAGGWAVTVFNNDHNTFDQVIQILMQATGCGREEAKVETWEIDRFGTCVVHRAGKDECEKAAKVISSIGIRVEVDEDD